MTATMERPQEMQNNLAPVAIEAARNYKHELAVLVTKLATTENFEAMARGGETGPDGWRLQYTSKDRPDVDYVSLQDIAPSTTLRLLRKPGNGQFDFSEQVSLTWSGENAAPDSIELTHGSIPEQAIFETRKIDYCKVADRAGDERRIKITDGAVITASHRSGNALRQPGYASMIEVVGDAAVDVPFSDQDTAHLVQTLETAMADLSLAGL